MTRAALAGVRIGLVTLALWAAAHIGYATLLCPRHRNWTAAQANPSGVAAERGERIARPGESIFVCERRHRTGIATHMDLDCYCAPASMSADDISRRLDAVCRIDKADPLLTDDWGSCRFRRCPGRVEAEAPAASVR